MRATTVASRSPDAKEDHHVTIVCAVESTVPLSCGWRRSRSISRQTREGRFNLLPPSLTVITWTRKAIS
ncbi:hypothetical protein AbraIFM66950_001880 [Aspergillus brasiliensis]|nr:hypothetical protein AbraIFM66950_001880 [Aspergillus brasiliensis]